MFRIILALTISSLCNAEETSAPGKVVAWTLGQSGSVKNPIYRTQTIETSGLSRQLAEVSKSKEVIAYLKRDDGQTLISDSWISNEVKSSSQSIIMPNVYLSAEVSSRRSLLGHIVNTDDAKQISLSQFRELMTSDVALSNGKVDAYIVSMTGSENDKADLKAISSLPGASRILLIVADEPSSVAPQMQAHYSRILSYTLNNNTWEGGEYSLYSTDGKFLYITPDIFTGVATGLFFFFVLITGYSCLGDIQGPGTFANKLPALGKEA